MELEKAKEIIENKILNTYNNEIIDAWYIIKENVCSKIKLDRIIADVYNGRYEDWDDMLQDLNQLSEEDF